MPAVRHVLAGILLAPCIVSAGEIKESSVTRQAGTYMIDVTARIDAPVATVHRVITDYNHLDHVVPSIVESRIRHRYSPDKHRVHTVMEACILFFCKRVTQLQDIVQHGTQRVEAVILPAASDFHHGHALWELTAAGADTYIHFTAELEPAFWVPPLIGPWLFERQVIQDILVSARYIESAAHRQDAG
jgi:hypothetical protein